MKLLNYYFTKLKKLLFDYNLIIFVIFVSIGLVVIVLTASSIVRDSFNMGPSEQQPSESTTVIEIDQNTINKINSLNTYDKASSIQLPSGRINPFSE